MDINFVYITAGSLDEARAIGQALVTGHLAACVNIIDNMRSLYIWQGQMQEDQEVILIAKTTRARVAELITRVKSMHSYDCPCIVSLPVQTGSSAFLDWIAATVAPSGA